VKKFRETYLLQDNVSVTREKTGRTDEIVAAVEMSVTEDPNLSIRSRGQHLDLLGQFYKNILVYGHTRSNWFKSWSQTISRVFADWALNQLTEDPLFYRKIIFSDEAHFLLNGYVNNRIWSDKLPKQVLETPLHPKKFTVWCSLFAGGIIGPYFFKIEAKENVTVNGSRYRSMISDWFSQKTWINTGFNKTVLRPIKQLNRVIY